MLGLLVLLTVVMAVRKHIVIMGMRMPGGPVLPLVQRVARMVVRDMEVIVSMCPRWVRVLGLLALTLGVLSLASARWSLHVGSPCFVSNWQTSCRTDPLA